MNIKFRNYLGILKFQEGGEVAPTEAPVEGAPIDQAPAEGGADPMAQLVEAFTLGLQNQDCELLALAALAFLLLVGGGGEQQAPGAPVYRKGGKLSRWI